MEIEAEQVAGHPLDLPLAEAVGPGPGGQHGLQVGAEPAGGDALGWGGAGSHPATGAAEAMQAILIDDRLDPGQLGDLLDQGGEVVAVQGLTAVTARIGLAVGGPAEPLGRDQDPGGPAMPGLAAPLAPALGPGRLALQADGVGRRGLGRVGGIELEPGLKVADALLQLSELLSHLGPGGQEGGLGFWWDGVPEWSRDRRLRAHAADT